ncbi:asparaginase [Candidatus Peregrinibacteria bacterium]|nr:MAG: asparaginase [Candidatus Peregrinibacteria bacterium]
MSNDSNLEDKSVRKKILIIGYGGTIMMVVDPIEKTVKPADKIEEVLALLPNLSELADIELVSLTNKDSTNITPDDWTRLTYFIQQNYNNYDGFVITHGTNTLAYTGSALALSLGNSLSKPVVLTGSQLPLTVFGNDARFNFENSVKTCIEASRLGIGEVMITFNDVVLRAARSVKISEASFRAFTSPAFPPLAIITATGVHFSSEARRSDPSVPLQVSPHFSPTVFSLDLTPGQRPSVLEDLVTTGKCKAVILKSYGAGSVPTDGEFSFLPFIEKVVHSYGIPVIVATKFLGGNSYKEVNDECAVLALKRGAIPSGDMTDIATEVKLMWLLAQGHFSYQSVADLLLKDFVGEVKAVNYRWDKF